MSGSINIECPSYDEGECATFPRVFGTMKCEDLDKCIWKSKEAFYNEQTRATRISTNIKTKQIPSEGSHFIPDKV